MKISDLRELNKTVASTRKQNAEKSAVNLQKEKVRVQTRAMEKKAAAAEGVVRSRKRHAASRAVLYSLGACAALVLMAPAGWYMYSLWIMPQPLVSMDSIVEIDRGSYDATMVDRACREFLAQFRRGGVEGVMGYFSGLPPFLVDSAVSNLETVSQKDFFQMTSIRKDQRISAYQIQYVSDDRQTVLCLSVVMDVGGGMMITGVYRG